MVEQILGRRVRGRRGGGRSADARRGAGQALAQTPWMLPRNPDAPTEPLSEEGVQAIHDGAMRVLEEIGIEFLNDEAKGSWPRPAARSRAPMSGWAATS